MLRVGRNLKVGERKIQPRCPECGEEVNFEGIVNLMDLGAEERRRFAEQFKRIRSYELPLCCICGTRKQNDKLSQLADGHHYHLHSCARESVRMVCCGAILYKSVYDSKYPARGEDDRVSRFFPYDKQGNGVFRIEGAYLGGQCVECEKELRWESVQQLLSGDEGSDPGPAEELEFRNWAKISGKKAKCFLCGGTDLVEKMDNYWLCGSLQGAAHSDEMQDLIRHRCSLQVPRQVWLASITQEFEDVLADYSNFFVVQGKKINQPYCPKCHADLEMSKLNEIFFGKIEAGRFEEAFKKLKECQKPKEKGQEYLED